MYIEESVETEGTQTMSFAQVFEELETDLLYFALKQVSNQETAEDIVQEAFLKLYPLFNDVKKPRPWLYRTVYNLSLNHNRFTKKIVDFPSENIDQVDDDRQPNHAAEHSELIGLTRVCLEELDSRARRIISLRFEGGYSYKEIAEQTGLSATNVGFLLHGAVKLLGEKLSKKKKGVVA